MNELLSLAFQVGFMRKRTRRPLREPLLDFDVSITGSAGNKMPSESALLVGSVRLSVQLKAF